MRKPAWVFDTRSVVNSENLEKIGLGFGNWVNNYFKIIIN